MLVLFHELVMAERGQHPVHRGPGQSHVPRYLVDPDHLVILEEAQQPQHVVDRADQPAWALRALVVTGRLLHA